MISFTKTIHINRPIDEVYAYLADLEHTPEWNWAITETKKTTPGPVAVGTRYRQSGSVPRPAAGPVSVTREGRWLGATCPPPPRSTGGRFRRREEPR